MITICDGIIVAYVTIASVQLTDRIKATLKLRHPQEMLTRIAHAALGAVIWRMPSAIRAALFRGQRVECPICCSQLSQFLPLYRDHMLWCPVCRSLQRHRLVWLFLQGQQIQIQHFSGRVLHFAPEPALSTRLRAMPNLHYTSADLFNPADLRLDLCNLDLPDNAYDLIYCSHVLEHVTDDRLAIREIWRVLAPGGRAIILVPITAPKTYEDPSVTDPAQRERLFGQHDHVRVYGYDVAERLAEAGFSVTQWRGADLVSKPDAQRYGINLWETIFFCAKP